MSNPLSLSAQLEALLLFKGGPLRVRELGETLGVADDVIEDALLGLETELSGRGVALVREGAKVALTTSGDAAPLIEAMRRDELEGPLGKAGLETLAVIVYQGPISRADIEYVRGVNVSTTLRSLSMRGLIERVENPNDKRSFLYQATTELPAHLGVTRLSELPGFDETQKALKEVVAEQPTDNTEAL